MDIRILFIDDEPGISKDLSEIFDNVEINNHNLVTDFAETFAEGLAKISDEYFDLIVSDLCKGKPSEDAEKEGLEILREIQGKEFTPIIFYSGIANSIKDLESEVVGVIDKKEGADALGKEIDYMISSNIVTLRSSIESFINSELREYFWDIIHNKRDIFKPKSGDYSLGYLMLRRLANALSKEKIKDILNDEIIDRNKSHSMEFYIYPSEGEFSVGDIIEKDNDIYLLLTPSCDYVERFDKHGISKGRKVGNILIAKASLLSSLSEYKKFKDNPKIDQRNKLIKVITNNHSERFYFLPQTPFIKNMVLDFQDTTMVEYEELATFSRIARLDSPYAESAIACFLRYYNRIGTPDIDVDYILTNLTD